MRPVRPLGPFRQGVIEHVHGRSMNNIYVMRVQENVQGFTPSYQKHHVVVADIALGAVWTAELCSVHGLLHERSQRSHEAACIR